MEWTTTLDALLHLGYRVQFEPGDEPGEAFGYLFDTDDQVLHIALTATVDAAVCELAAYAECAA